jgi:predicted RNA-binding Zn-ribbon protein involved in translation (DUF1610 family)
MATRFDAIAASELRDTQGEILDVKGADISELVAGRGIINDNHSNKLPDVIGRITGAKKIFGPEDCENERQKYYWNKVKAPYIYTEGLLYDDEDHRSAKAAAAIIKHQFKTDSPLKLKCSVEGGILERGQKDQRVLKRTKIRGLALTLTPANNATLVEGLDLAKSAPTAEEIDLIKSYAPHAVIDVPALVDLSQRTSIAKIRDNVEKIHETVSALKKNTSLGESLEKASKKQLLQQLGSDPKAAEVADWLSKDVKRDDVQQWFLRNYKKDPGIYNDKNKHAVVHYIGTADIHKDHDIGKVRFDKSHSFEDGMKMWQDAEQKLQSQTKGADNLLKPDDKTKKLIDLGNGWGWYDLGKGYDAAEGKAMSHCGNVNAKDVEEDPDHEYHHDRILSLRKEHNINGETYHEPRLSFIENKGYLGETKGFGNSKPAAKYHDAIIELLKHPRIKENIGGGYAPNNNFYLNDLPKDKLDKLLKDKPNLEKLWSLKSGEVDPKDYPQKHADDAEWHNQALKDFKNGKENTHQVRFRDIDPKYAKDLISKHIQSREDFIPGEGSYPCHPERVSVMQSPHLDKSHIEEAFDASIPHTHYHILGDLLSSHAANKDHISRALDHDYVQVRYAAVQSPHFGPQHVEKALNDESQPVRFSAVASAHFKPEHMDKALNDEDHMVRAKAIRSPHFGPQHMEKVLNDNDELVRFTVEQSPHYQTYLKQKGLTKALTAGYGGAEAPTSRTGGSVLQTESMDQGRSFRYIDCPNCGKEQVYMAYQTKCRSCNKSFPFDTLAKFFLNIKK